MQTLGKVGAQSIIFTWTGREFDLFLASGDNLDAEIFCIKVLGRKREPLLGLISFALCITDVLFLSMSLRQGPRKHTTLVELSFILLCNATSPNCS